MGHGSFRDFRLSTDFFEGQTHHHHHHALSTGGFCLLKEVWWCVWWWNVTNMRNYRPITPKRRVKSVLLQDAIHSFLLTLAPSHCPQPQIECPGRGVIMSASARRADARRSSLAVSRKVAQLRNVRLHAARPFLQRASVQSTSSDLARPGCGVRMCASAPCADLRRSQLEVPEHGGTALSAVCALHALVMVHRAQNMS